MTESRIQNINSGHINNDGDANIGDINNAAPHYQLYAIVAS